MQVVGLVLVAVLAVASADVAMNSEVRVRRQASSKTTIGDATLSASITRRRRQVDDASVEMNANATAENATFTSENATVEMGANATAENATFTSENATVEIGANATAENSTFASENGTASNATIVDISEPTRFARDATTATKIGGFSTSSSLKTRRRRQADNVTAESSANATAENATFASENATASNVTAEDVSGSMRFVRQAGIEFAVANATADEKNATADEKNATAANATADASNKTGNVRDARRRRQVEESVEKLNATKTDNSTGASNATDTAAADEGRFKRDVFDDDLSLDRKRRQAEATDEKDINIDAQSPEIETATNATAPANATDAEVTVRAKRQFATGSSLTVPGKNGGTTISSGLNIN